VIENTKSAACLEASYKTAKGNAVTARFRLKQGEITLQVEPAGGAERLRVECPSRFTLLPDFFADDIVIDAASVAPDSVELPSENFLLHLAPDGDSITMCVFENRQQDVKITLSDRREQRKIDSAELSLEGR